jgi:regulator of sigma E protease
MFEIVSVGFCVVLLLSFIVFVHEFGHYFIARMVGVRATDFAIGFGPKIFGIKDSLGTEWKLCWVPLGGYVRFIGDSDVTSIQSQHIPSKDIKFAFATQSLIKKAAIAVAGPLANFVLAIVILSGFFFSYGKLVSEPEVSVIEKGSVADINDLKVGDVVISIDGKPVREFADIVTDVVLSPNIPLHFELQRGQERISKTIVPRAKEHLDSSGRKIVMGALGIASTKVSRKQYTIDKALFLGIRETMNLCAITWKGLKQMVTGVRSARDMGGIITIGKYTAASVREGWVSVLMFIALISVNLGLINLMPIPPLDGGHIMLYTVDAIFGKKVCTYVREYAIKAGTILVVMLMIFALINDIRHF